MWGWARHRQRAALVAGVVAVGVVLAGCSGSSSAPRSGTTGHGPVQHGTPSTSTAPVLPAPLTSSVKPAATGVPVDTVVSVTADNGTLKTVEFSGDGKSLPGSYNADRSSWTADGLLDPATHYTLRSLAVNADGKQTRSVRAFTSADLTLDQQTYPSVTPLQGQVMGIGMPVIVTFDIPVTDRAAFEKHMTVTSSPAQAGSWHWIS